MAFTDLTLQLSNAQAITSTAASTVVYDVTGAGSGNAPNQKVGGTSTYIFGADIGVGRTIYAWFIITTAFVTGGGATLAFAVQASPANSGNTASGYVTLSQSQAFAASALTLGATLILPVPPVGMIANAEALPRFYRADYIVGTSTFSAGAVSAFIGLEAPTGFVSTLYPNNFSSGL